MKDKKNIKMAIGMISGTSLDGIDAAIIKSDGEHVERIGVPYHKPYTRDEQVILQEALAEAKKEGRPTNENSLINDAEKLITRRHFETIENIMKENHLTKDDVDIIGFHGQTVLHGPDEGWTWQIGDGKRLAEKTGISVIHDFRRNDMENGGEGAPLAPIYHHVVASQNKPDYPVALLNFGGVGNITWIGGPKTSDMLAFDTGPANALLDDWVRKHTDLPFDRDGLISTKGKIHKNLVQQWMQNGYFDLTPPKSLDRDEFNVDQVNNLSLEDGAATLCAFSVEAVKVAEQQCLAPVKNWYVCGGGAQNPVMMKMLSDRLQGDVQSVGSLGFDSDYIEAEAFALMAIRKIYDLPITFPGTTGVSKPSTGGVINSA